MRAFAIFLTLSALHAAAAKKPAASTLNAKDDEEDNSRPAASAPALCADQDRAFANALAWAFEQTPEEIRVFAIEDLGLLGDPRALDALAMLVLDPNPAIQSAAIRSAGTFTTTRATQILENVVRHPRLPNMLKEQALRLLPFHRKPRVREFLQTVSTSTTYPQSVRLVAKEALSDFDPSPPPTSGATR